MRKVFLLCAAVACCPLSGLCGDPPEVTLQRTSREYLFFQDDIYQPGGEIPRNDALDPEEHQTMLRSFGATLKLGTVGTQEIPALHFECQGVRYILPAHQIIVLVPPSKEDGLSVVSRSDPNDSGDVEILLLYRSTGERSSTTPSLDRAHLPDKLKVLTQSSGSSYNGKVYSWRLKLILRNDTDETIVLKQGNFKDLPEVKDWPAIEIAPAPPKDPTP